MLKKEELEKHFLERHTLAKFSPIDINDSIIEKINGNNKKATICACRQCGIEMKIKSYDRIEYACLLIHFLFEFSHGYEIFMFIYKAGIQAASNLPKKDKV